MDIKGDELMDQNDGTYSYLLQEITRIKDDERELYALDRERQKVMADIQQDIREIVTEHKSVKKDLETVHKEITGIKNNISEVNSKVSSIETKVDTITQTINNTAWTPKDKGIVIVAVLSLIGTLATALLAFLK